ncbi:Cof-type HAD-IIB family hydrolase [Cytobacillus sp. Hz8]|uniref:Cof-type HAD-IIB family hydrolase n=1 Tax=Cytobacillus sp. Hz8 TaxID=3347168 RepID=UPI0035D7A5CF
MIKCIATDMDGTLLTAQQKITEENIKAIREAQSMGIEVVVATGRSYSEASSVLKEAGLTVPYICVNGAEVRTSKGEVLTFNPLEKKIAREATKTLEQHDVYYEIYTNHGTFTNSFAQSVRILVDIITTANPNVDPSFITKRAEGRLHNGRVKEVHHYDLLLNSDDHHIYKLLAFAKGEEQLAASATNLRKIAGLSVSSSGYNNIELTSIHAQKGIALEAFINERGISLEETMAIGDNYNDLSMLSKVGRSVAMGNADENIKAQCHFVTASNEESGVGKAIFEAIRRN